jgi:hypothetical protein
MEWLKQIKRPLIAITDMKNPDQPLLFTKQLQQQQHRRRLALTVLELLVLSGKIVSLFL